ncbi:hypothetical protein [Granulosicoccus antarcticus]|uniref:Uncharacterized protein n=1 Tax=Granulosicoccus antarcticus IMCC3135 TaxID=1192854 RepID=A0A2Z2NQV9_9GAMM|nr:hypothetical protein [Granulosicoccus antarcticus]ASJ72088.1 hypothetical protein IMCC3135_09970 [Granulosicoccus antarcticus IMCC3135]
MSFTLVIEDIFRFAGARTRVVTGTLKGGAAAVGDSVSVSTSAGETRTSVTRLLVGGNAAQTAPEGAQVGMTFALLEILPVLGGTVQSARPDQPGQPILKLSDLSFDGTIAGGPTLLLPLRIETAFEGLQLRLRAFPDSLHIASDESRISASEELLARQYLVAVAAGQPAALLRPAIDTALGSARASFVLEQIRVGSTKRADEPLATARPVARCLPHRLFGAAFRRGRVIAAARGLEIPREVPVGPAPGDTDFLGAAALSWLSDFDAALAIGMALEMTLPDRDSFDRLVVFGVGEDARQDQSALEALMHSHNQRANGVTLPEPGQPTKGGGVISPTTKRTRAGGARLAGALGLDAVPLSQDAPDIEQVRTVLADLIFEAAVRPAAEFLFDSDPALSSGETSQQIDNFKKRFLALRPDGVLPILRVGEDPVALTIAALDATPRNGMDPLRAIIESRAMLAQESRDVRRSEAALPGYEPTITTLARHDRGQIWRARDFLPPELVLDILTNLPDPDRRLAAERAFANITDRAGLLVAAHGVAGPHATSDGAQFSDFAAQLCGSLVAPGAEDSTTLELNDPNLENLLAVGPLLSRLQQRLDPKLKEQIEHGPLSLLAVFAEHLFVRALAEIEAAHRTSNSKERSELLGHGHWKIPKEGPERLRLAVAAILRLNGGPLRDLAENAAGSQSTPRHALEILMVLPDQLEQLAKTPPRITHRVMAGLLDTVSHRADVWEELAAKDILDLQRSNADRTLCVGAYGVIEGPLPVPITQQAPAQYITAPSARLATTLAILWRARKGLAWHDPGSEALLPADLSRETMSTAQPLLAALRRGDDLSDSLAVLVIDHLQRVGAAGLEADIAGVYPAQNATPATALFDGLAFLDDTSLQRWSNVPVAVSDAHGALTAAAAALRQVLVAEGASALSEGRPEAAQAALAGLGSGAAPPDDISVSHARMAGETVALHVALATDWLDSGASGTDLRAILAPELAQIANLLLGPIAGQVNTRDGRTLLLSAMVSSALELAYIMAPGRDGRALLMSQARTRLNLEPHQTFAFDRAADDTLWLAGRLFLALANHGPLMPQHLGVVVQEGWREDAITQAMARTRSTVQKWRAQFRRIGERVVRDPITLPILPGNLIRTDSITLADTFITPHPILDRILGNLNVSTGPRGLMEIGNILGQRLTDADAAGTPEDALKALLGDLPIVLPFRLADSSVFDQGKRLKHAGPSALLHWMEDSATVQDTLEPLADLMSARNGDMPATAMQWNEDGAVPNGPETDWIGGPRTKDDVYPATASCVVVGDISTRSRQIAGLYLDGWPETIPPLTGETGIVIDIDAPSARAPQVAILGVRTTPSEQWNPTNVAWLVHQVVDRAQARLLGPTDWSDEIQIEPLIRNLGATLPMLMVEHDIAALAAGYCVKRNESDM